MKRFHALLLTHLLLMGLHAPLAWSNENQARGHFFQGKEEGWFWYKDPKDKAESPPDLLVPVPEPSPDPQATTVKRQEAPFSVSWLRQQLPVLLDRAIDTPSRENVEAYLYAQRVTMDKSQRFAEAAQRVVYGDPFLDENNRVPIASFARSDWLFQAEAEKNTATKALAGVAGIWVFFDSRCGLCKTQLEITERLRNRYGFLVRYISVDGRGLPGIRGWVRDQGHAANLGIQLTPTTVLVAPPDKYLVVSQGMMAEDQLQDRLLVAAESAGLLPQIMTAAINPYSKGVLKPEDTRGAPSDDDPVKWVQYLKDRLKGRY